MQGGLRNMLNKLKITRKLFTPDQYDKEEKYLNEMSMNGYHLVKFKFLKYYFEKDESKKYNYQIDYVEKDKIEDYEQLLKDAGWEKISTLPVFDGEWLYLKKESKSDNEEKIFTDQESIINLCKKIRKRWGLIALILVACFSSILLNAILSIVNIDIAHIKFSVDEAVGILILYGSLLALYLKIFVSLTLKINKMENNRLGY